MPEGDTVWYTARRLDEALAGHTLTRTDFRVPRLATATLAIIGLTLELIVAHLILKFMPLEEIGMSWRVSWPLLFTPV